MSACRVASLPFSTSYVICSKSSPYSSVPFAIWIMAAYDCLPKIVENSPSVIPSDMARLNSEKISAGDFIPVAENSLTCFSRAFTFAVCFSISELDFLTSFFITFSANLASSSAFFKLCHFSEEGSKPCICRSNSNMKSLCFWISSFDADVSPFKISNASAAL